MKRSRTDIAVDILKVANNGAKKTHIVYRTNLNFNIACEYLETLREKELTGTKMDFSLPLKKERLSNKWLMNSSFKLLVEIRRNN